MQDFGAETVITAERKEQFTYEIPDVIQAGAKFAVRAFDVQRYGIEASYMYSRELTATVNLGTRGPTPNTTIPARILERLGRPFQNHYAALTE